MSDRATRQRAGPSNPTATKSRRKQTTTEDEASDDKSETPLHEVPEITVGETRKPAARKPAVKGKGKAKAQPPPKRPVEVEEIMDDEDDVDELASVDGAVAARNRTRLPPRTDKSAATLTKENDRLTRQLNTAQSNINELARQLKDAYRLRYTEPEEERRLQDEKYQETIRVKDDIIKQQSEMLSQKEPLASEGKSSVLYLVTREKADAEKRSAEEQVEYWRRQADDRILEVQKRDQEIAKLTQQVQDLQYEIGVERERSQKAAARNPQLGPARSRGPNAVLGSDDPKHAELIKFYEDITNTLVTDIKIQEPTYFGLNEWNLTCIYTYADKLGSDESKRSLGFLLRLTHEVADDSESEPETSDELERRIQYTPLDLDKESPDFVTALQFLNTGFTFPRRQLPLFFISLVDNMKRACGPEMQEPEQEESMEEEEE